MQDLKEKVAQSFGDKADAYNRFAFVQRIAAERFGELAEDIVNTLSPPYIELGCGTGFVTQHVARSLAEGDFYVTDISSAMLRACKRDLTLPPQLSVVFQQHDAEKSLKEGHYGLIITALTAQWFESTHNSLLSLLDSLKPNGVLIYSYLDDRCFPEWKALCAETGIPYTGNTLPASTPLKIDADTYSWEFYTPELFSEQYESPAEFFRNLKRIGAGTQKSGQKNNPGAIVALNEHWVQKGKPFFTISYGITFGAIRRKA